ncbi:hypothetical protein [Blastococcus sp. SYSU DS0539]
MPLVPPDDRLVGRWRRSLLIRPDGSEDRTTSVVWLQAGRRYVDLRLPAGIPDAGPVGDLAAGELAALAAVEGFAGELCADGRWTRWERTVDLQPAQRFPDEGLLEPHGADLVETGRHARYLERWQPTRREPAQPVCAAELEDVDTGAPALLVRVGDDVGWARGRREQLPPGGTLADVVASGSRARTLAAFDTEVALGAVAADGRVVLAASSLPGRAGATLALSAGGDGLQALDHAPDGAPVRRRWRIRAVEGDPAALPVQQPSRVPMQFPHPEERSA